jgi:Na+-driven multidrug efflux pump
MSEYYRIIMPFVIFQLIIIPLYFFIRLDGLPNLAAAALAVGAVVNIVLDYFFIAVYDWGLTGAAWATGLSEVLSLLVIMLYFFRPEKTLSFSFRQNNWREIFQAAYNGISEFINEISGAIIAFIFNWMLIQRAGVEGVAAITVVNYMLMTGFMMFFAIEDTSQVMISQNFGARNAQRIRAFLKTACFIVALISLGFITILATASESLIYLFVDEKNNTQTVILALEFVTYVWPIFIFAGFNMMITGYLTAAHLPFQSALLALSRGLVLPTGFLILFYILLSDFRFIAAFSISEGIAFMLAIGLFISYSPEKAISDVRG